MGCWPCRKLPLAAWTPDSRRMELGTPGPHGDPEIHGGGQLSPRGGYCTVSPGSPGGHSPGVQLRPLCRGGRATRELRLLRLLPAADTRSVGPATAVGTSQAGVSGGRWLTPWVAGEAPWGQRRGGGRGHDCRAGVGGPGDGGRAMQGLVLSLGDPPAPTRAAHDLGFPEPENVFDLPWSLLAPRLQDPPEVNKGSCGPRADPPPGGTHPPPGDHTGGPTPHPTSEPRAPDLEATHMLRAQGLDCSGSQATVSV